MEGKKDFRKALRSLGVDGRYGELAWEWEIFLGHSARIRDLDAPRLFGGVKTFSLMAFLFPSQIFF